ncbi:hypothetical protein VE04_06199 [Pseudogymnoascus sp. 24MN13]|nr:hypothetical protein VE04_06199 [Pseudogymnoascus sp. 24MN13]
MTKAQQTISLALLVSPATSARPAAQPPQDRHADQEDPTNTPQLYLSLYLELVPLPALIQSEIIPVLPFWALVSFGSYLLFKLGLGVFTYEATFPPRTQS